MSPKFGRRHIEASAEEVYRIQFTSTFSRAVDQLQPNIDPSLRTQVIDSGLRINPAATRGKNIEVLAAAIITILTIQTTTPQTLDTAISEITPVDARASFSTEVFLYILFLQEYSYNGVGLADTPELHSTWLNTDLADTL